MKLFPEVEWDPGAEEYYNSPAPDGTILHGSSALRRFIQSPRIYGLVMMARIANAQSLSDGEALLHPAWREILQAAEPAPWMLFGNAVDAYLFNEEPPELDKATLAKAARRAAAIRCHPDVGPYLTVPGARFQVAHRWRDRASGLWLRMRYDEVYHSRSGPAALDLKIWSRCSPGNVRWKVRDFGADIQAALYRRGALDLWGEAPPHSVIVAGPGPLDPIFVTQPFTNRAMVEADAKVARALDGLAAAYADADFADPAESKPVSLQKEHP